MLSTLLLTPLVLAVVSAQLTNTLSNTLSDTGVQTYTTAAAMQMTMTTPPAAGSLTATGPADADAAAVSEAAAAAYATAYGTAAVSGGNYTDACGPTIPDPTVPDSCDTPVLQVDQPAAYGVQCLNDVRDLSKSFLPFSCLSGSGKTWLRSKA